MSDEPPDYDGKRVAPRLGLVTFAWYKRVGESGLPATALEEGVARSCDISDGGLGLVTSRPLPEDARVFLEMLSGAGAVSVVGRVTHCRPVEDGQHRIGLELEIVPPNDRQKLAKLLAGGSG